MKFLVCAVGQKMPAWIAQGFSEYSKRMPREASIELMEIRPEKRGEGRRLDQLLNAEAMRIRAVLPARCHVVVMDERGKQVNTAELAGGDFRLDDEWRGCRFHHWRSGWSGCGHKSPRMKSWRCPP